MSIQSSITFKAISQLYSLKGEALAALQRNNEAIQIWKGLTQSKDDMIAKRAHELITKHLTKKAILISTKQSTEAALSFFIQEHLKLNLVPTLNEDIAKFTRKVEPLNSDFSDPDLRKHELKLQFNTLVIKFLEDQLLEKDRLSFKGPTQKSVTIKETIPTSN